MKILFLIGTGSFIGGISRYLLSHFIQTKLFSTFPFGTLAVNLLGCFAIGVVFSLSEKISMDSEWRLFLATGLCGGFTTFSAFSIETLGMLRDSQFLFAGAYIISSIILGLLLTYFGIMITKLL